MRLWDPATATGRGELTGHTGWVRAVAAVPLPDGTTLLATAGADRTVRLWDPATGNPRGELTGHTGSVWAVAAVLLPDGTTLLATAGADAAVIFWEDCVGAASATLGLVPAGECLRREQDKSRRWPSVPWSMRLLNNAKSALRSGL